MTTPPAPSPAPPSELPGSPPPPRHILLWVLVALAIALLVIAGWAAWHYELVPGSYWNSPAPSPAASPTDTHTTFRNDDIAVTYDPPLRPYQDSDMDYIPLCGDEPNQPILCLVYPKEQFAGTNFSGAGLSLNLTDCSDTPEGQLGDGQSRLGTVLFEEFAIGEGAAGNRTIGYLWHTPIDASSCLDIRGQIHSTVYENYPEGSVVRFTEEDESLVLDAFRKAISTVEIAPRRPDWNTYRSAKYGFTIQYSDNERVIQQSPEEMYIVGKNESIESAPSWIRISALELGGFEVRFPACIPTFRKTVDVNVNGVSMGRCEFDAGGDHIVLFLTSGGEPGGLVIYYNSVDPLADGGTEDIIYTFRR